jgi:hypothetical protein
MLQDAKIRCRQLHVSWMLLAVGLSKKSSHIVHPNDLQNLKTAQDLLDILKDKERSYIAGGIGRRVCCCVLCICVCFKL